MSILVRRIDGSTFEVTSGNARLQASLAVFGKATVTDVETKESFDVHMVDGELMVLTSPQDAAAATLAHAAIAKAAIGAGKESPES